MTTLVAVILAWRGRQMDGEREAVKVIHRVRGGVFYHQQEANLVGVCQRIWWGGQSRPEYITFRHSPLLFEQPEKFAAIQPQLKRLGSLRRLNLEGTFIGDEQLPLLAQLSQLKQLDLRGTSVSREGIASLRQRLPGCQVID